MNALDPRIVTVSIEVNGQTKIYSSPLAITATGTKYANALQNECVVTIDNLDRETQDYLLTETSPYNKNRTPKTVTVRAGRESYGTSIIYVGNIVNITVGQPPDITVSLKCLTGNFLKGNIFSNNQPASVTLQQLTQQIATNGNYVANFQATDKNISNYNTSGNIQTQIDSLNQMGNINAFVDDNTLVVKNAFIPLTGTTRILSAETGMIGIPEFTEQGVKVKFLVDNQTKLGGGIEIRSVQYPATNGQYSIYKLGFQIASREQPFYYIAEAARRR
jgi:hypothetical protein